MVVVLILLNWIEECFGYVSCVCVDVDLLFVVIFGCFFIMFWYKIFFVVVVVIGVFVWIVVVFFCNELVNVVWIVVVVGCIYIIGFWFYVWLIEMKVVCFCDDYVILVEIFDDGIDYVFIDWWVVFGYYFVVIVGVGLFVGLVLVI